MNFWKVILATVVIFGAGVLTGGFLVDAVHDGHARGSRRPPANSETRPPRAAPELPPRMAERMGKQFVQQLNDTLQLTPEQLAKIERIIAAGQEQNHQLWTNIAPKMRAVMQEVNQNIRAELTPDQVKQFEELLKHPPKRPGGTNAPTTNLSGTNAPSKKPPGA